MITTKNVQTLKTGESRYVILFLTHISSQSARTAMYSTPGWLSQKSQYVVEVVVEEVH